VNFIYFLLLAVAFAVIHSLIGGTRLLFSYPSYMILGAAAGLSLVSFWRPVQRPSWFALLTTALLGGYVMLRAWYSPYPYLARDDLFMTAGCVIVYLFTALYLTGPRDRHRRDPGRHRPLPVLSEIHLDAFRLYAPGSSLDRSRDH
jgi:Na+/H+ antiporter NhaD/arsenite permease-like protein